MGPSSSVESYDSAVSASSILLVDSNPETTDYANVLRQRFRTVNVTHDYRTASQYMRRENPALVVASMTVTDGSAVELCREAKSTPLPPKVLMTAEDPAAVPDVLAAGCDSVLLTPILPSLLINRAARLLRIWIDETRLKAACVAMKSQHLRERIEARRMSINREWRSVMCPHCATPGVTSFDYASNRRAWYACLHCRQVWIAKRLDS